MSLLIETIQERLADRVSLEQMAQAFEDAKIEIANHRDQAMALLAGAPEELVRPERQAVQVLYGRYEALLDEGQNSVRVNTELLALGERIAPLLEELGLAVASIREAAWAARGPSSHPGANELLVLLDGLAEEAVSEDEFETVLERELVRVEHQWDRLDDLPDFAREAQEVSLKAYQDWLRGVLEANEDDPRSFDDMMEELEQWALDYSSMDLDFLQRRYSSAPTAIPAVNFALNCQRLDLEELISEDVVDYAVDSALGTLKQGRERFLQGHTLSDVDSTRYQALMADLLSHLEDLTDVENVECLQKAGNQIRGLVDQLMTIHQRAEGEARGSRLDYKDPA